ncbi:LCP family protein [Candidatus Woesebacteria bacterium]|nr:LCP family protein [Candidatus Woesebacteria bacterium]
MEEVTQSVEFAPKKARAFQRIKRRLLKHLWLVRIGLIASILLGTFLFIAWTGFVFEKVGVTNYGKVISNFIFAPASKVKSLGGRTNILILGKGGEGHAASELTDTIIFASISHDSPKITLVSLPRDIWIPEIRAKANSAYYWGKQKIEGGGLILAKSTIEEIVGQPVHYGLVVDFSGFTKIIDFMGGIDVDVKRGFIDEKYPIPGKENDECEGDREFRCRYETIRFESGIQKMDGATALKFVRSRNAEGEEGTDIARAKRQQKVLLGIRQKILSPTTLLSPRKLLSIWKVVKSSIESDISADIGAVFVRRVLDAREEINTFVLAEELLENPPVSPRYDNQYVFIPKAGDWSEVHKWISEKLQ